MEITGCIPEFQEDKSMKENGYGEGHEQCLHHDLPPIKINVEPSMEVSSQVDEDDDEVIRERV